MSRVTQLSVAEPPPGVILRDRRAFGRGLISAVVIMLVAGVGYAFATSNIQWSFVAEYFFSPRILDGLAATLVLWVVSLILGVGIGFMVAMMQVAGPRVLRAAASAFVWFFRGVPVYVQFLVWFNIAIVFPMIWIPGRGEVSTVELVTPFVASTLALALSEAAYLAEIFRGGIMSVDKGQRDASRALGIHAPRAMMFIVLPQAMRSILPPAGNEAITLLKTTSLAAAIGYTELLTTSQTIYYNTGRVMELLIVASIWYLAVTSVLSIGQHFIEAKYSFTGKTGRTMARRTGAADAKAGA
ncbi:amino acid ABC transporter permease [Microbacterium paludicola]|uniref:amino acid ABC transporter permease n=1 Tax=Microbacterium paludicola TaxID=300019 RepID=UPI0011A67E29|nr:amino acid ABC transporter permease [Microbacterium paludicola]